MAQEHRQEVGWFLTTASIKRIACPVLINEKKGTDKEMSLEENICILDKSLPEQAIFGVITSQAICKAELDNFQLKFDFIYNISCQSSAFLEICSDWFLHPVSSFATSVSSGGLIERLVPLATWGPMMIRIRRRRTARRSLRYLRLSSDL